MKELTYILIVYGISNIMVFSTIFSKWRAFWDRVSPNFFGQLFSCMICLPFWVGIFLSITVYSLSYNVFDGLNEYFAWFLDGCISSGSVWLIHTLQERLEND